MQKYSIVLESVEILNTRSRHEDTDTVVLGYVKNYNGTPQIKKKFIGNVNNGKYNVELFFNDIEVADTDTVLVTYYIVNTADASVGEQAALKMVGTSLQAGAKALAAAAVNNVIGAEGEAAIASAIGTALGSVFPGLGNLIGGLVGATVGYAWGLFTANCDGPVAFGAKAFTGAQMARLTTVPGGRFFQVEHFPGLDSPHGCGSNSNYNVSWSILNHPAALIGIPANGTLLREENGAIWVVYGGAKFHVPDPSTLTRLFGNKPVIQVWNGALNAIPAIPVDGTLLREENGAIWVVYGGAKFHVPDPSTLTRLFGGKPVFQVWNGALNAIPAIPVDGTLLREENGAIWVVYGGAKFHVPDPSTLTRLFGGKPVIQVWNGALNAIPAIPVDGTLLREENGAIWVVYGGAKFHVPDPSTLTRLFGGKPVFQVWNGALNAIPAIPVDGTLLREENGAIWVVYGGAKFHVPDPSTLTRLFGGKPVFQVWNGALNAIPAIPVDGTLFREESSSQIYVIHNGKKEASQAGAAGQVHILWSRALAQIPSS